MGGPDDVGAARDASFLRAARPLLQAFASWFRPEVRGFDRLPAAGPFLVVGNHSGGQTPPDVPVLLTAWWRERGVEEPLYVLFHSFFLDLPGVGSLMAKGGGLEADPASAEAVLGRGGIVLTYPGGDHEVLRPFRDRNRIDFGGRQGFVRLALRAGVPVVPAVTCGAHEAVVILTRGEAIARVTRIDRLFRIKSWPIVLGPPWGIVPAGIPTIPLPTKIVVELGPPIDWRGRYGPAAADDPEVVERCYHEVVTAMQSTLDRLAAQRRWPVLG